MAAVVYMAALVFLFLIEAGILAAFLTLPAGWLLFNAVEGLPEAAEAFLGTAAGNTAILVASGAVNAGIVFLFVSGFLRLLDIRAFGEVRSDD